MIYYESPFKWDLNEKLKIKRTVHNKDPYKNVYTFVVYKFQIFLKF